MRYKPDGYPDLSPYLVVEDAQAVLAFAAAAFDARPGRVVRRDDGTIMHAEAHVGDGTVMLGEAHGGAPMHLHLYLPDPDAALSRALAAEGTLVEAMSESGDGDRRGGVRSPDGTTWWLARQVVA